MHTKKKNPCKEAGISMAPGYTRRAGVLSRSKAQRARQAVARASQLLKSRTTTTTGSLGPPATRGFYGAYRQRGIPELKFVDTTSLNNPVQLTWNVGLVNGIAQGTDFNQRIGRKAMMKSILFNGNISPAAGNSLSQPQGILVRVVLIYDTQPNSGTIPVGTDIFASNDANSPMNLNNRDRFKVIIDRRCQLGSFATGATGILTAGSPNNSYWSKYRKLNHEIIFSGTANTIGSISTGAIYLAWVGDANNTTVLDHYTRIRYMDN